MEHFCDDEDCPQGAAALQPENRIDAIADRGPETGVQWVGEVWSAPIGNRYWQSQRIYEGYMRQTPTSPQYGTRIGSSGPSGHPWGGSGVIFPGNLFMFAQMESIKPYPAAH